MSKTTYTTYTSTFFGDKYRLRADFAEAGDSIYRDDEDGAWVPTGWQVADFAHSAKAAMAEELRLAVQASRDADCENGIDDAIRSMVAEEETTK